MSVLPSPRDDASRRFPGEPALWVFFLADMLTFGVLFATIVVLRADDPALFQQSQDQLSRGLGLLNTGLLLGGSLAVVLGVDAVRRGAPSATRLLGGAIACGVAFIGVKAVEWGGKFADGVSVTTNDFWSLYFMLTGIHLAHVVIGVSVLVAVARAVRRGSASSGLVDGGACYWHLVDLLWLVLFPLLYLLG